MAKKRDYVLENALAGDLDAIENILGQVYAPLFDLSFHVWGSSDRALPAVTQALEVLASQLVAGKLDRSTPYVVSAQALLSRLEQELPEAMPNESPLVAGLAAKKALALLARCALDLDGAELDEALSAPPERGARRAAEALGTLGLDEDAFRDQLDEVSAGVALPEGLVDSVVSRFETDDEA